MSESLVFDPTQVINTGIQSVVFIGTGVALYFGLKSDQRSTREALNTHTKETEKKFAEINVSIHQLEKELREGGYARSTDIQRLEREHGELKAEMAKLWDKKLDVADYERERDNGFRKGSRRR